MSRAGVGDALVVAGATTGGDAVFVAPEDAAVVAGMTAGVALFVAGAVGGVVDNAPRRAASDAMIESVLLNPEIFGAEGGTMAAFVFGGRTGAFVFVAGATFSTVIGSFARLR